METKQQSDADQQAQPGWKIALGIFGFLTGMFVLVYVINKLF